MAKYLGMKTHGFGYYPLVIKVIFGWVNIVISITSARAIMIYIIHQLFQTF